MLTSKQRAYLRSLSNTLEPVLYIGKDGISDNTIKEAYDVLEARELIKCVVQQNCEQNAKEVSAELAEKTHSDPVQCIGRRFVLYRESRENKKIIL